VTEDRQPILVVDDDPDIRQLVAELLRLTGFEPATAGSGVEALTYLQRPGEELPALVLLDVQMPELDGWDTLRRIRADPTLGDLPVVLCTVKSGPVDLALGWALGCDGYIVKPFAIGDLVAEVDAVLALDLAGRRARRARATIQLSDTANIAT
jgi:two-component system OmpR family response regulator